MSAQFETVILRFRDLVTSKGKTVKEHQEVIEENGYCWWGWWNKGGEQVPEEAFNLLRGRAAGANGLDLYLFDSGLNQIYRAKCVGLTFEDDGQEIPSPNPEATPEYYVDNNYKAWFKFADLTGPGLDEKIFEQLTYVDVPEFFSGGENHYEIFSGKVVSSARELRNQDRTIWFVRPRQEGDRVGEVELYGAQKAQPSNFSTQILGRERQHLIWLSDLHFGSAHGFPQEAVNHDRPLWLALEDAVKELSLNVAGVIISGDVTTNGEPAGFTAAQGFIDELASKLRLETQDFVLCPGNHDFAFSQDVPRVGERPEPVTAEAGKDFAVFYESIFGCRPGEFFASARRFLLSRSLAVDVVALNSVTLQQSGGVFQGYGFIGPEQLGSVEKQWDLKPTEPGGPRPFRILVLHHHLVPVNYSERVEVGARYSLTLDAEATLRWAIEKQFDLILHGHMHQPVAARLQRPISFPKGKTETAPQHWPIIDLVGLGSTGILGSGLGLHKENTFGVLSPTASSMRIRLYNIRKAPKTTEEDLVAEIEIPRER